MYSYLFGITIMKIKSITTVITNSSDEVFLLITNQSVEEVSKWFSENITGCDKPYKATNIKDSNLQTLVEWDYLFDPNDEESIYHYRMSYALRKVYKFIDWHPFKTRKYERKPWATKKDYVENSTELITAWVKFLNFNAVRINTEYKENNPGVSWLPIPPGGFKLNYVNHRLIPDRYSNSIDTVNYYDLPFHFYKEFVDSYKGPFPKSWKLPDHLNVNTYMNSIVVCSEYENSIPYEDMEKIEDTFQCHRFHLG